jgi:hypothetical protein
MAQAFVIPIQEVSPMMKIPDPRRGLVRCSVRALGLAAAAMLVLSAAPDRRAEALSLINPGAAPAAKMASDALTTEVRGGHGGGGHGGGGGGYHGGGAFHGAAIHAGGFRTAHVFHNGGFRHGGFAFRHHRRHFFYGASYYDYPYYYPYRRCHIVWTYYGPRRVCHYRHWRHHYRRHHHIYW